MESTQIPFEVRSADPDSATSKVVIVRIAVTATHTPQVILGYLRSGSFKADLMEGFVDKEMPGCGLEFRGGPRPIMQSEGDRTSPIVAYEQDVRLTKGI
jgi:hypothetical protein